MSARRAEASSCPSQRSYSSAAHPRAPMSMLCVRALASVQMMSAAALVDPAAFRAFWQIQGMTRRPTEVYTDPQVVARTRDVLSRLGSRPAMAQPTRAQLLAALAT
jgi:hypothetical protein